MTDQMFIFSLNFQSVDCEENERPEKLSEKKKKVKKELENIRVDLRLLKCRHLFSEYVHTLQTILSV